MQRLLKGQDRAQCVCGQAAPVRIRMRASIKRQFILRIAGHLRRIQAGARRHQYLLSTATLLRQLQTPRRRQVHITTRRRPPRPFLCRNGHTHRRLLLWHICINIQSLESPVTRRVFLRSCQYIPKLQDQNCFSSGPGSSIDASATATRGCSGRDICNLDCSKARKSSRYSPVTATASS